MSLTKHILVAVFSLNKCVPEIHGVTWTMKKEITQHIINCGVHNSLEAIDVADAIQKYNQGGRINKNQWKDHDTYFRPGMYFSRGVPKDQREQQKTCHATKELFQNKSIYKRAIKDCEQSLEASPQSQGRSPAWEHQA